MKRIDYRIEKSLDIQEFIRICKESFTMKEASIKLGMHFNTFKRIALKLNCYNINQGSKGRKYLNKKDSKKIDLSEILDGKRPTYQTLKLKNRLFEEGIKEKKCEMCSNTEWLGNPIPLELDHIDGDSSNHKLENIRIICPNCHATTDTYRGANIHLDS